MALSNTPKNIIFMIFQAQHELVDPCLPKTVQKVLVPNDQVSPRLKPEALVRFSFEHLLDESDSLITGDIEGVVTHIEDVTIIFFLEELELIGDQLWALSPPPFFIEGRFRTERTVKR